MNTEVGDGGYAIVAEIERVEVERGVFELED